MNKRLVLVSGASGDLGMAYLSHYARQPDTMCYGVARKEVSNPVQGVQYLKADLLDRDSTRKAIEGISLEDVVKVCLIHPVGRFKYEPEGMPEIDNTHNGIDDEVQASNVDTFHNIVRPLLKLRGEKQIPLKLVAFGSLSDSYQVPMWGSYSKSKLILRKDMRELARSVPDVKSLFVNLSSVDTENENKTRPFADKTYWIRPNEIATKTVSAIDNGNYPYVEIDAFTPSPKYYERYYRDFDVLRAKWEREMGSMRRIK